jgi:hypothetical protein
MPLVLLVLLELTMLVLGVYSCLVGFRFYQGGARTDPVAWQRWYRSAGHWLRFIGPFCLWLAVVLPLIFLGPEWLPAWAPGAAALGTLALGLVFAAATWHTTPKVGWPKGIAAWLGFLWLEPLIWSGIAMGILDFAGFEVPPVSEQPLWAWYLGGLAFARLRQVWFTRFLHHMRQGVEPPR